MSTIKPSGVMPPNGHMQEIGLGSHYRGTGKSRTRFGDPQNDRTRFSSRISWLLLTIKGSRANIWASFVQLTNANSLDVPLLWKAEATNFEIRAQKILADLDSLYADMHQFNRTKSKKQKL
jgi:hypothetical protein